MNKRKYLITLIDGTIKILTVEKQSDLAYYIRFNKESIVGYKRAA